MRNKLARNTISSLVFQICSVITGFILPRLILKSYGSGVNGLVNSVTQFLSVISFLELGVGAVVQSSLYKPLVDNDLELISKITVSANKFFRRIGEILFIYVVLLLFALPHLVDRNFSQMYTATLIAAMSISFFAQYFFGVVDRILLTADQKGYIQYNAQTLTLLANTLACVILIKTGCSIQLLKLTTSLIFLARPIALRIYVNKYYQIDRKIKYEEEPIRQKWNGISQHIATVVLDNTDTIVLTLFSSLANVSIYSVYHLVVYGIKYLFLSITNGIQALLGELWAREDQETVKSAFEWTEWVIHNSVILIFGCTSILIIPFVRVYTDGITDANYIQPLFAYLIVAAHAMHCLRLPYHLAIRAAGKYKETQLNYIIAAVLNIVVSVATVKLWGLIGVALGTLVAMFYQTIWMALYNSRHLIRNNVKSFIKLITVDFSIVVIGVILTVRLPIVSISYFSWVLLAIEVLIIWLSVALLINVICYRDKCKTLIAHMKRRGKNEHFQ